MSMILSTTGYVTRVFPEDAANDGCHCTPASDSKTYEVDTMSPSWPRDSFSVTAVASGDWEFSNWVGGNRSFDPRAIDANRATWDFTCDHPAKESNIETLDAVFTRKHHKITLVTAVSPAEAAAGGCYLECTGSKVREGIAGNSESFYLTPHAATGWRFVGYAEGGQTNPLVVQYATYDKTVTRTAVFERTEGGVKAHLRIELDGDPSSSHPARDGLKTIPQDSGSGIVKTGTIGEYPDDVMASVSLPEAWKLVKWKKDGEDLSTDDNVKIFGDDPYSAPYTEHTFVAVVAHKGSGRPICNPDGTIVCDQSGNPIFDDAG